MRRQYLIFVFFLLFVPRVHVAYAASFDCNRADTEIESSICNNSELSRLDELIALEYFALSDEGRYTIEAKRQHLYWLRAERVSSVTAFKRQLFVLRFMIELNECTDLHSTPFVECLGAVSSLHDECMEVDNYTTFAMNQCGRALVTAYRSALERELSLWRPFLDNETLALFDEAQKSWEEFVKMDCEWQWSEFRDGTIAGPIYASCMTGQLEDRIVFIRRALTDASLR